MHRTAAAVVMMMTLAACLTGEADAFPTREEHAADDAVDWSETVPPAPLRLAQTGRYFKRFWNPNNGAEHRKGWSSTVGRAISAVPRMFKGTYKGWGSNHRLKTYGTYHRDEHAPQYWKGQSWMGRFIPKGVSTRWQAKVAQGYVDAENTLQAQWTLQAQSKAAHDLQRAQAIRSQNAVYPTNSF